MIATHRMSLSLALMAGALILGGCATGEPRFATATRTAASSEVRVERLYIYCFLDYREKELSREFMEHFERQLKDLLAKRGVTSEQLWFKRSPVEATYALAPTPEGLRGTTTRLPVGEVILANKAAEAAFAPTHLLVVFPSGLTATGTGYSVGVRWTLVDVRTQKTVWATSSSASHMLWARAHENALGRAQMLADGFVTELAKEGMVK